MRILIFIGTLIYCCACASLSPQQFSSIEKEKEIIPLAVGEQYVFKNYPFDIRNFVTKPVPPSDTLFVEDMLWKLIDPKFKVEGTDWFNYAVEITVKSTNSIEFSLIDSLGNTIRKKALKYNRRNSFSELKPKFWFWNNYILINGFNSQVSAFAMDQEGNLIVAENFTDGAFLIIMPFAGSQQFEVYTYPKTSF